MESRAYADVRTVTAQFINKHAASVSLTPGSVAPLIAIATIFAASSDRAGYHGVAFLVFTGGVGAVGAFLSLLAHEFGHVRAARRASGVTVLKIEIMALGAATHLAGSYRSANDQIRVAAAGPLASLGIASLFFLSLGLPLPLAVRWSLFLLATLNVALAALALLPIHPLDGHKLLVGLAWLVFHSEMRARIMVRRAGFVLLAFDAATVLALVIERPLYGAAAAVFVGVIALERFAVKTNRLDSFVVRNFGR
jgi:Zn-dependent protease